MGVYIQLHISEGAPNTEQATADVHFPFPIAMLFAVRPTLGCAKPDSKVSSPVGIKDGPMAYWRFDQQGTKVATRFPWEWQQPRLVGEPRLGPLRSGVLGE
ncbi:hypothetical protein F5X99DRAFT_404848 [Biscogniauxia marginata]|nr:hypothetical protein F5X99DRAFT_404848 [Biscogniauxia marginata]